MHALIRNDTIVLTGPLPYPTWPDPDAGRWRDMRDPAQVAEAGWVEVVTQPRPDDTATTTWERKPPELVDGVPTVQWVERDKTPEELQAEADARAAQERAETHEGILDATAALMEDAHEDGQPWVQPQGAHDAYALGVTVTHGGKTWENLTHANVWQPGVSGWREVVAEGYPAWVAPTGSHDAYNIGDRVSFEGSNYESTINGNTWSPTEYPAGWTLLP